MNRDMVERVAAAFNGGSYPNAYAKQLTERNIVKALAALTEKDLKLLLNDLTPT